ncbi:MAG: DivIVA domain-containing protein [Gulosibacter sp.]|uniref:DivIVA domain-containing protein n=1 Tax=Gulosibacter sp. TaxID=2817531 RepID=UPI003F93278C
MRSDEVLNEQFRATKYSVGYDQREVDHFLDRVVDTLRKHESGETIERQPVTAATVQSVQFAPTRFREGYDPHDVDQFLDRLKQAFLDFEHGTEN